LLKVEHLDDVIVRKQRRDFELALETLDRNLITRDVGVQQLERNTTPLLHIERFVHAPHPAVRNDAPDLVAHRHHRPDARIVARLNRNLRRAPQL
jgi:hypothetical protein